LEVQRARSRLAISVLGTLVIIRGRHGVSAGQPAIEVDVRAAV
jgi:hypothetical protein